MWRSGFVQISTARCYMLCCIDYMSVRDVLSARSWLPKELSNYSHISVHQTVYENYLTKNARRLIFKPEQKSLGLMNTVVQKFSSSEAFGSKPFVGTLFRAQVGHWLTIQGVFLDMTRILVAQKSGWKSIQKFTNMSWMVKRNWQKLHLWACLEWKGEGWNSWLTAGQTM